MGRRNRHRKGISIHTPLAGSDQARQLDDLADRVFQSTLPLRGATGCGGSCRLAEGISIHTPLAGSDRRNETFLTK